MNPFKKKDENKDKEYKKPESGEEVTELNIDKIKKLMPVRKEKPVWNSKTFSNNEDTVDFLNDNKIFDPTILVYSHVILVFYCDYVEIEEETDKEETDKEETTKEE